MKNKFYCIVAIISLIFFSCSSAERKGDVSLEQNNSELTVESNSKAKNIIAESINAHGGVLYNKAHFSFTFRGNTYRFKNDENAFEYEYNGLNKKGDSVRTLLNQEGVKVWINNEPVNLNEKQKVSYSENLNSVIYFATLPHKLKDNSVNKTYEGTATIFSKVYEVIKVTFDQEGGGTDFDDEYYYWINSETKLIDYLAYNYQVNGGGVRFRMAYNPRKIDGIHFQDYVNYKANIGTPLADLPKLLEKGQLVELSRIVTEEVVDLK